MSELKSVGGAIGRGTISGFGGCASSVAVSGTVILAMAAATGPGVFAALGTSCAVGFGGGVLDYVDGGDSSGSAAQDFRDGAEFAIRHNE